MQTVNRKNQRFYQLLCGVCALLLLGYAAFKTWHISTAMDAWKGQKLTVDTTGAAK